MATPAISAGSFPEWMYPVPVLGGPLLAVLAGLVEVAAAEDHLDAEGLHRFDLHRVACSGTQITARKPNKPAAYATDWP